MASPSAVSRRECVFLDTNVIANAIYGQYRAGKEDRLKYEVAADFDSIINKLLKDSNVFLCINEFQEDVELERAIINEFINRFIRAAPKSELLRYGPEDLVNLFNIKETLLKELKILKEVNQLLLIKHVSEPFIKVLVDILLLIKAVWPSRKAMSRDVGGYVGSQDFIIAATIYYLLSVAKCSELKFYTCDSKLYRLLSKLSDACSEAEVKYSYDIVFYRESSQKEYNRLVICGELPK